MSKHDLRNEKTPEGASSYSLSLNMLDYTIIEDTLKDYALKLVANAHSEMSDKQWSRWLNNHTWMYASALNNAREAQQRQLLTDLMEQLPDSVNHGTSLDTWNEGYNNCRHQVISVIQDLLGGEK